MLEKRLCWDSLHSNDSSRLLVQDLRFIKKYWAEYISRTHLLTLMLQSESPGISLVYTIHTYFWRQPQHWVNSRADRGLKNYLRKAFSHTDPSQAVPTLVTPSTSDQQSWIVCQGLSPFQLLHVQILQILCIKEHLKPQKTYIACRIASWDKSLPHPAPAPYFSDVLINNSVKSNRLCTHYLQF